MFYNLGGWVGFVGIHLTGSHTVLCLEEPILGLKLCGNHLEMLSNFWTRVLAFSFCTASENYVARAGSRFYVLVYDPFWGYFCIWFNIWMEVNTVEYVYPIIPAPFVEKKYPFFYWIVSAPLLKIVYVYERVYFWPVNSIPLAYLSVFMPWAYYLGYCSFIINLENQVVLIGSFSKLFWLFCVCCISYEC